MKVMMYTACGQPCGIRDYTADLVRFLRQHVECELVAVPEPLPPLWQSEAAFARRGRAMNAGDLAHLQHSFAFWGGASFLRNRFDAFRRQVHVPVVMTVHDIYEGWERAEPPPARSALPRALAGARRVLYARLTNQAAYLRHLNVDTFASAEALIVHSASQRELLAQRGIDPNRITVMPMGIPLHRAQPADPTSTRQRWDLQGRRVLTMWGFVVPEKGYDLALRALAELPSDVVLLVAGSAREIAGQRHLAELRDLVQRLRLEKRVRFTGFVSPEDVPGIMAASDLVLAPFHAMSGSSSLALCLAFGKPIIASDLPPNREINAAVPCLALFPAGDQEALVRAIRQLLGGPLAVSGLSRRAAEYARLYSFERMAASTAALYQRVLER